VLGEHTRHPELTRRLETIMTTPNTRIDEAVVEPTEWLVELTGAGTAAARWVLGTEQTLDLGVAEDAWNAPGAEAGAAPDEDVADWVAEYLGVTGVELVETDDGRWSVGLTG
jgi:hypothetical protein